MSTALLETAIVDGSPPLASPADSAAETARGRWQPSTATVAAIGFALAGLVAGLRPIHDNSFLTHLATGRLLLHGTFPRHDPYSFTAHGTSWIVESWLPSLGYAAIEKVLGGHGLLLLQCGMSMAVVMMAWRLTRPARSLVVRELVMIAVLFVNVSFQSPRPLVVGLLCLGATILLAENDSLPAWWLLPLGWVWVNSHGSWPLGIGYLVLRLVGRRIDRRETVRLWRVLRWSVVGTLAGVIGPVGPKVLLFPFHLLSRHAILSHVVEWSPPSFSSPPALVFLGAALIAVALASRGGWEDVLTSVVFVAMAMTASRNVAVASLVLIPIVARHVPAISPTRSARPPRTASLAIGVLLLFGVATAAHALTRPDYNLQAYPVAELAWMRTHGLASNRVAAPDFVGNYRTWAEGAHGEVFLDDRYDMYPPSFTQSTLALAGLPGWDAVLDRYHIDAVLWPRHTPLAQLLARDSRWAIVHQTIGWVVAIRAGGN